MMYRKLKLKLTDEERFRLRYMYAYEMQKKEGRVNVRKLCVLFGIGKSTFYKWRKRYKSNNLYTVQTHSRRPKHTSSISWDLVIEICRWKRDNPAKSHYYLYQLWLREIKEGQRNFIPCSPKTIYNWWKKRDLIVQKHKRKRRKTKLFNQAKLPGELIQVDTKYLEGRRRFQYTAIDVCSKWRFLRVYTKLEQASTIDFIKRLIQKAKEKGISIQRIQTDNGLEFQAEMFSFLEDQGIEHQYIWIHTPDQNGVVERSHRTDDEEFYHFIETKNLTLEELNAKLEEWTNYYNTKRLHFSLNFDTPLEYLQKQKVSTI
jgi:transposase InsO family protein